MRSIQQVLVLMIVCAVCLSWLLPASADEFTKEDLKRWEQEFITVVNEGDVLFHSGKLGGDGVSCDQCHPNATNTHPETYPKLQKQIGRVVGLRDMIRSNRINSLLIWYAGHGTSIGETGYWIPVDATRDDEFCLYNLRQLKASM